MRTAIGRAVVKNPDVLLCDEPTGALDYNTSKEILALIEQINKTYGNTVIMVTHNEAISRMADHVIRLRDGMVLVMEMMLFATAFPQTLSHYQKTAVNDLFVKHQVFLKQTTDDNGRTIIERNRQAISMAKILGYSSKEIASLYMTVTTVVVALWELIAMAYFKRIEHIPMEEVLKNIG